VQEPERRKRPVRRIAVLFHEAAQNPNAYVIGHLARFWREDGHEVVFLFGTEDYVPADIVVVHVDLSVVPEHYLRFAARYPRVINGGIRDIRKSVISSNLLRADDPWPGAVIVKSNLNCAGMPERGSQPSWLSPRVRRVKLWRKTLALAARMTGGKPPPKTWTDYRPIKNWRDYRVYDRLADVPEQYFADDRVVVERFLPEFENGLYRLRVYQFLGDKHQCTLLASPDPVFKSYSSVLVEKIEPSPETSHWRRQLNMDYGHFDYVVHNGEAVLFDANKTTAASDHLGREELEAGRRILAQGIYAYIQ
jgi:hypothetical protein